MYTTYIYSQQAMALNHLLCVFLIYFIHSLGDAWVQIRQIYFCCFEQRDSWLRLFHCPCVIATKPMHFLIHGLPQSWLCLGQKWKQLNFMHVIQPCVILNVLLFYSAMFLSRCHQQEANPVESHLSQPMCTYFFRFIFIFMGVFSLILVWNGPRSEFIHIFYNKICIISDLGQHFFEFLVANRLKPNRLHINKTAPHHTQYLPTWSSYGRDKHSPGRPTGWVVWVTSYCMIRKHH